DILGRIERRFLREQARAIPLGDPGVADVVAVGSGHDLEQGALSRAVLPDHPDLRVGVERQRDPPQDLPLRRGHDLLELIHRVDELRGHGKTVAGRLYRVVGGDKRNFPRRKDLLPSRYELRFELEFDTWSSTGWERIALRSARPSREITLHALALDIFAATIDGKNKLEKAVLDTESETATLRFANDIPAGEHTLEISWK